MSQENRRDEGKQVEQRDTFSLSSDGENIAYSRKNIAANYDVNDISQKERLQLAEELMDAKLINSGVALHLIAPTNMHEKPTDRSDFLSNIKESLKVDRSPKDSIHMKSKLQAIEILEELAALRT